MLLLMLLYVLKMKLLTTVSQDCLQYRVTTLFCGQSVFTVL